MIKDTIIIKKNLLGAGVVQVGVLLHQQEVNRICHQIETVLCLLLFYNMEFLTYSEKISVKETLSFGIRYREKCVISAKSAKMFSLNISVVTSDVFA